MIKQNDLLLFFLEQIVTKGDLYQKTKGVWARVSDGGEKILSKTSDGVETYNISSKGDFVVKNDTASKEEYIVKPNKFHQRYVLSDGDYFVPNQEARVYAIQITRDNIMNFKLEGLQALLEDPTKEIYIEAPWSESQRLRLNDYLVTPLAKDEVYRIAEKEFNETYTLVK